jgi:hypothetical protein
MHLCSSLAFREQSMPAFHEGNWQCIHPGGFSGDTELRKVGERRKFSSISGNTKVCFGFARLTKHHEHVRLQPWDAHRLHNSCFLTVKHKLFSVLPIRVCVLERMSSVDGTWWGIRTAQGRWLDEVQYIVYEVYSPVCTLQLREKHIVTHTHSSSARGYIL